MSKRILYMSKLENHIFFNKALAKGKMDNAFLIIDVFKRYNIPTRIFQKPDYDYTPRNDMYDISTSSEGLCDLVSESDLSDSFELLERWRR